MPVKPNRTLRRLRAGESVFGAASVLGQLSVPSLYAAAGLDFIWLDLEHTLTDPQQIGILVQQARLAGITPIVRTPGLVPGLIRQLLDNGAQGIVLPFVESRREVEDLVSTCRFHPRGRRGIASPLLANDFTATSVLEHVEQSDAEVLVAIQVESLSAVERVDELLGVEGLDVAIVGMVDLSISCGVPGEVSHPRVLEAAELVLEAAVSAGIAAGIAGFQSTGAGSPVTEWQLRGARFFHLFGDLELLADSIDREVRRVDIEGHRDSGIPEA